MIIETDGKVYHPLGGGSYVYEDCLISYLRSQLRKKEIRISIGAQPNSSPHLGTLEVFCLAFATADMLKKFDSELKITVFFEMVDTAPATTEVIDGIKYQLNLKQHGELDQYLEQYHEILNTLSAETGIGYQVRGQEEFNSQSSIPNIVKRVVENMEILAPILEPQKHIVRIRVGCPVCGLTDKNGIKNEFIGNTLKAFCPKHGWFTVNIEQNASRLEFNTPVRNLIRGAAYMCDNINPDVVHEWLRITGTDYAGFYQEQLLYRAMDLIGYRVSQLPMILYAPLVTDWSGAKLSKSLYVKQGAYKYLPDYLIHYDNLRKHFGGTSGLLKIFSEVHSWLEEPYKLFRNYSVHYFEEVLK